MYVHVRHAWMWTLKSASVYDFRMIDQTWTLGMRQIRIHVWSVFLSSYFFTKESCLYFCVLIMKPNMNHYLYVHIYLFGGNTLCFSVLSSDSVLKSNSWRESSAGDWTLVAFSGPELCITEKYLLSSVCDGIWKRVCSGKFFLGFQSDRCFTHSYYHAIDHPEHSG